MYPYNNVHEWWNGQMRKRANHFQCAHVLRIRIISTFYMKEGSELYEQTACIGSHCCGCGRCQGS